MRRFNSDRLGQLEKRGSLAVINVDMIDVLIKEAHVKVPALDSRSYSSGRLQIKSSRD